MAAMETVLIPRTGLWLGTPIIAASGTLGYGVEFAKRNDLAGIGAIVSKGTTLRPRRGNEPLRLVETPAGMLNSIGLQNVGVDELKLSMAPHWRTWTVPVFVNISGTNIDEFVEVVSRLDGTPGIAGIELNISCPNVKDGGVMFGSKPKTAAQVTASVRKVSDLPLVVKLSPNVSDIRSIASAVQSAGADAVSLINTVQGMSIDAQRRSPTLQPVSGGLSGPAIKPLALHMVFEVAQEVTVPIVGMGGILSTQDALEFLMAGASAVAMATALLLDPGACLTVCEGIEAWCREQGVRTLSEIIGVANSRFRGVKKETGSANAAG